MLKRIVLTTIPITILSFYLIHLGFFLLILPSGFSPCHSFIAFTTRGFIYHCGSVWGALTCLYSSLQFSGQPPFGQQGSYLGFTLGHCSNQHCFSSLLSPLLLGHFWPSFRHTAYADFHWFKANSYHYDSNFYPLVVLKNQKR
ncbi:hypothetical protein DMNBHIDG_01772 [Candidatus Methanoperedenaceae archaeon GB37]|nr:hypothetical protein DMNBHIDG_01772 [Candidatus Methanoperedenaceae archaeon GB37]